jgi:SAM-dependent methyltransferase
VITVDVEALPRRQPDHHVERLIWGRFDGNEVGMRRMMDIAGRHGHPLTCFVDFCETELYGELIDQAAQEIAAAGHDVQLHAHPDLLPDRFWRERDLEPANTSLTHYGDAHATALMAFLRKAAERTSGRAPVAFRGGAFRFNKAILEAMAEHELWLSFNYNVKSDHQLANTSILPAFTWANGVTEVPMSALYIHDYLRLFEFSATSSVDFTNEALIAEYIDSYFNNLGEDAILVMLLHSWSFLYRNDETGYFEYRGDALAETFDRFLSNLPADIEVVSATGLHEKLETGEMSPTITRPLHVFDPERPRPVAESSARCNFCGTPAEEMIDFGGREKVRCPKCLSLERQRIFLAAYEGFIRPEFDLAGQRILAVAPSDALLAYLRPISDLTAGDVRPVEWYDRQVDISHMPEVADESFDAVIAKAVLQHVRDDEAALDEIHRVLVPWGRVLLQTSVKTNAETVPVEDPTMHYGPEALADYNVGTFRIYGDRSLLESLQKRFLVKTFYGRDPVTGRIDAIFCGIKRG